VAAVAGYTAVQARWALRTTTTTAASLTSVTTTAPATTIALLSSPPVAAPDLYYCYFEESDNCTFTATTVCTLVSLNTCNMLNTPEFAVYVYTSRALFTSIVTTPPSSTPTSEYESLKFGLHMDSGCNHGLLGAQLGGEDLQLGQCHVTSINTQLVCRVLRSLCTPFNDMFDPFQKFHAEPC
jgi:hypothetical protein